MKFLSSLTEKDLANKICLLRVDLNIQDADLFKKNIHPRILAVLPTIEFLIKNGAKVVILSHRGRPTIVQSSKLKVKSYKQFSLKPFAKILSSLLKTPVRFIEKTTFHAWNAKKKYFNNNTGNIFLLENLRFFPEEGKNNKQFAKKLASLGDIYINDAFAVSHRANASVAVITKFLPSYVGLLLEKEIKNLDKVMKNPKRPLIIILGGAKISDKIGLIKNFLEKVKGQRSKVNCILVGGGMVNTFLAAQGLPVGDSLYEEKMIPLARKFLKSNLPGRQAGKIILPIDTVVYKRQILDIGPKTVEKYSKIIKNAKTIIWNGPMGYIEDKKFRKGSEAIAKAIIKSKAFSIIGGGETTCLLKPKTYNLKANVFISTGGGAMLEYLAGKKIPGIEVLK